MPWNRRTRHSSVLTEKDPTATTLRGGPVMSQNERPIMNEAQVYDTPQTIAMFRLDTIIRYAAGRAKGMHLVDPRKARSVQLASLRAEFGISARRWEQAEAELRQIRENWVRDGVPEEKWVGGSKKTDHAPRVENNQAD